MKYKYMGLDPDPILLIEFHKEVKPGDVVVVETPINHPLFVLVEEEKKAKKEVDN